MLSVALAYRVGEFTAHMIVKETCSVIINILMPICMKPPTKEKWKEICVDFFSFMEFTKLYRSDRWETHNYSSTSELWIYIF